MATASAALHIPRISFRLESHEHASSKIEHRSLDHRRLRQHQGDGLALVQVCLVHLRKFTERRSCTVEQRLPANLFGPSIKTRLVDTSSLVIVESISHAMLVEPAPRLLD